MNGTLLVTASQPLRHIACEFVSSAYLLTPAPRRPRRRLAAGPLQELPAMSKRQAILKTIWSPLTAVFRTKNCAATSSNLVVVNAGGEIIAGGGREDAIVTRKSRSSLEDLLKIESSSNPGTMAADEPLPDHMASPKNSSMESELQVVLAGFPENGHGGVIAGRPPASLDGGGGAVVVRAQTVRVKVNRLVVLVPSALRARSRAAKMVDAAALPAKRGSYWRIAGRGRGGDKSELFYQRPIPLGRRCRVQHLEEVTLSDN